MRQAAARAAAAAGRWAGGAIWIIWDYDGRGDGGGDEGGGLFAFRLRRRAEGASIEYIRIRSILGFLYSFLPCPKIQATSLTKL